MKMKKFKANPELLPYIIDIFRRRHIYYILTPNCLCEEKDTWPEGYVKIESPISSNDYHKIIVRASMEKFCADNGIECLCVAESEAKSPKYINFLQAEYNTTSYKVVNSVKN